MQILSPVVDLWTDSSFRLFRMTFTSHNLFPCPIIVVIPNPWNFCFLLLRNSRSYSCKFRIWGANLFRITNDAKWVYDLSV
jgi:hypothetical protein